jgi:hypothetical protein
MDWKSEDVGVVGKDGVIVQGWGDSLDLCAFPCRVLCDDNHLTFRMCVRAKDLSTRSVRDIILATM